MIQQLETARLILRPAELADADQAQHIFPHWEIVRFMQAGRVPWPYPEDGALHYYCDVALPGMTRGDEWHWSIRLKSEPVSMVGSISLRRTENSNRGFWMGLPWQGLGLMSEAANAVTDYWFYVLGFAEMRVAKAIDNTASRRISERNGMRVVEVIEGREYVGGRFPTEVWCVTAEEWKLRQSHSRKSNAVQG